MWMFRALGVPVCAALFWLALASVASAAPSNTMVTVAGVGSVGSSGDGGPATTAYLNAPRGIAQLGDGSILIADHGNHKIRKLSTSGIITTVAGNGVVGSSGDGGQATLARLNLPWDVAVAPDGVTYYITEYGGHRIRRVDASGVITTVAGTGVSGFSGDLGPAASAQVSQPLGLGVAVNGDLYFADYGTHRVRMIVASGGLVSGASTIQPVAGTGSPGFSGDFGPATLAQLNSVYDVLPMPNGRVLIADRGNNRIREIDEFGVIRTLVGTCAGSTSLCGDGGLASAANAGVYRPASLASDGAGGYLISDEDNFRIRRVNASGVISSVIGSGAYCADGRWLCGDGGPGETAAIGYSAGVLATANGTIYYSDNVHRIRARVLDPVQVGAAGAQGSAGATGAAGAAGGAGAAGAAGATGAQGAVGAQGAAGAAGSAGSDGLAGTSGAKGAAGTAGPKGAAGLAVPLFAALVEDSISVSARSSASVRLFVSSSAALDARVFRNGRLVRRVRLAKSRAGVNTLRLGRLRRGTYRLQVTATTSTSISIDRASVRVR